MQSPLGSVFGSNPKILILGSFPGRLSLEKQEYYAAKRNCFWSFMNKLVGTSGVNVAYSTRIDELKRKGIALWDVVESCDREGSADNRIKNVRPNEIPRFVLEHPSIERIIFNGRTPRKLFDKAGFSIPECIRLVDTYSTSAACTVNTDTRLQKWSIALGFETPR